MPFFSQHSWRSTMLWAYCFVPINVTWITCYDSAEQRIPDFPIENVNGFPFTSGKRVGCDGSFCWEKANPGILEILTWKPRNTRKQQPSGAVLVNKTNLLYPVTSEASVSKNSHKNLYFVHFNILFRTKLKHENEEKARGPLRLEALGCSPNHPMVKPPPSSRKFCFPG